MSVTVKYKGNTVVDLSESGTKTLKTSGKYCEGDITVENVQEKTAVSWHQCPEAVRNYLANVSYDPADYSVSQIASYAPATAVQSNTKPVGKTVDGASYHNEVPNVETPFATADKAGTLKPLDRLRWINSQTDNFRDLGGWSCDGGTVRYGRLFRGAEPVAADKALALGLGIRHELNLRGNEVAKRTKSVWDIEYTQPDSYTYHVGGSAVWQSILRTVFDCVLKNIPLYFHCYAGADRTGVTALVLEAILGVSQSDCDKDYELTCFYSGTGTDDDARRRNEVAWTTSINYLNSLSGDTFRDRAIAFAVANGISYEEINAFRSILIDGSPEAIIPATPALTNLLAAVGYAENTRLSTSSGGNKAATGAATFGSAATLDKMIELNAGDVLRVKGVSFPAATDSVCAVVYYNADASVYWADYLRKGQTHYGDKFDVQFGEQITTFTVPSGATTQRMRFTGLCTDPASVVITKNQEIV